MSPPDPWLLCDPYYAQFKCYHEEETEMNENPENEPVTVTEAELARVLELDAKATKIIKAGMPLAEIGEIIAASEERDRTFIDITPRLARELAAARAAIKAAREILTKAKKDSEHAFSPSAILEAFSTTLTQLNNHYE